MDLLFAKQHVFDLQRERQEAAKRMAAGFSESELVGSSVEDLVQQVVDQYVPQRLALDVAGHWISKEETQLAAQNGRQFAGIVLPNVASTIPRHGLEFDLHIAYTGDRVLFTVGPSARSGTQPRATILDGKVLISIAHQVVTPDTAVEPELLAQEAELVQWVQRVNEDIDVLEKRLRGEITADLKRRRSLLQAGDDLLATMTIPVRHVDHDQALELPVRPTPVPLTPVRTASSTDEWTLSVDVYEQVIGTITKFARALERRPDSAYALVPHEERLRDWLIFLLNANYEDPSGGDVFIGGETVNGKGKTDILVRHEGENAFIGECKYWTGPSDFDAAIDQLLDYTVWRDTKAALILFITRKNATAAIDSADERLRAHQHCQEGLPVVDPTQRRDYRFTSPHDDQKIISLALLPVVVRPVAVA